jgi:hypothetical protein
MLVPDEYTDFRAKLDEICPEWEAMDPEKVRVELERQMDDRLEALLAIKAAKGRWVEPVEKAATPEPASVA